MPPLFGARFMRHVGYPLFLALKSRRRGADLWPMRRLRFFERMSRARPEVWQAYRDGLLRRLLDHALREIPFYSRLPRGLASLIQQDPMAALREFPVLTKRDIQERGESLFAADIPRRRLRLGLTGGSTGERTRFWLDRRRDTIREMGAFRMEMNAGWRFGEPMGLIWTQARNFLWTRHRSIRALKTISRMHPSLDHFHLTLGKMLVFLAELERDRPSMLRGYASSTDEFARFLEESGFCARAQRLGLRGIITTCETLHPFQRERIERVFGCKVFNMYASNEAHTVAMECPAHHGLHVNADNVVVELLDESGCHVPAGETGRVVVTDLWNYGFSLIRLDLQDVAQWLPEGAPPCSCGMTFPRLSALEGRTADFLTFPDGARVHGFFFIRRFAALSGVRQLQLIQETRERVTMRIVGDPAEVDLQLPQALAGLPPGVTVDVQYCDHIPLTPAGKHRWIISRV